MSTGRYQGERLGACTDCRRLWAQFRAGTLDGPDLNRAHDQLMPTSGTCMVMGTASTMACLAEALGVWLPGGASIPAVHSERLRMAERSGRRAVELARTGEPDPVPFTGPRHRTPAALWASGRDARRGPRPAGWGRRRCSCLHCPVAPG